MRAKQDVVHKIEPGEVTEAVPSSDAASRAIPMPSFCLAWRISVACVCADWMLTVVLLAMILSLGIDYGDTSIVSSPLADPDSSTPLAWCYACISFMALAFAWLMLALWCGSGLCKGKCFRHGSHGFHRERAPCRRCAGHCCLSLYILGLLGHIFFLFLYVWWAPCVQGFPNWTGGGICTCDKRDPLLVEGAPRYALGGVVPANLKIAFIGDTDTVDVSEIYKLIRAENASAVVANGDLDYQADPSTWSRVYSEVLGNLPCYVTVGNHDNHVWRDYQDQVESQYSASNITECAGSIGVREVCTHAGVALLLSGAGSACGGLTVEHSPFISSSLQRFQEMDVMWKVCNFHKNNYLLQTAHLPSVMKKVDEVGLENYRLCLQHGAMIFTSHKHQYARTHEVDSMSSESVHVSRKVPRGANSSHPIRVGRGRSFVVVNGLGGRSFHRVDSKLVANEWWAMHWTRTVGAFFCQYHVLDDPRLAWCYFKDIHGALIDNFYVRFEE